MYNRFSRFAMSAIAVILFSGCANVVLTERNVSLITATTVKKNEPPQGITDTFQLDNRVYVYGAITWEDVKSSAGSKKFESKWYKGEKLLASRSMTMYLNSTPFYAWDSMNAIAIGVGEGRVDVYIDGLFVGSKKFKVVEKL